MLKHRVAEACSSRAAAVLVCQLAAAEGEPKVSAEVLCLLCSFPCLCRDSSLAAVWGSFLHDDLPKVEQSNMPSSKLISIAASSVLDILCSLPMRSRTNRKTTRSLRGASCSGHTSIQHCPAADSPFLHGCGVVVGDLCCDATIVWLQGSSIGSLSRCATRCGGGATRNVPKPSSSLQTFASME
jgi:hypothetical protein